MHNILADANKRSLITTAQWRQKPQTVSKNTFHYTSNKTKTDSKHLLCTQNKYSSFLI